MLDAARRIEYLEGMSPDEINTAPPRDQRSLGSASENDLKARITELQAEADSIKDADPAFARQLVEEARSSRNELGLRSLEDLKLNPADGHNIKSSWYTDSVFYKALTTPMKRVLQGKYPDAVKKVFAESFYDAGISLYRHSLGLPVEHSIFQKVGAADTKWIQANDEFVAAWVEDTGASPSSLFDVNATNVARNINKSGDTYRQWLDAVSEKRLKGVTDFTPAEARAVKAMDTFFERAMTDLEEFGLINNQKGLERRLERTRAEVAELRAKLDANDLDLDPANAERNRAFQQVTAARLQTLKGTETNAEFLLSNLLEGKGPPEPFFHRVYDLGAIKRNRDSFEKIIADWYTKNPYTIEYVPAVRKRVAGLWVEKEPAKLQRKRVSTDPVHVAERVKETVDGILGEGSTNPLDGLPNTVATRVGSRTLDIPNSLITDFIHKNPVDIMRKYQARVEPMVLTQKQFGTDLKGIKSRIERDMTEAGHSVDEIDTVLKDYTHMYHRIAGGVLDRPEAWDRKTANFLREASTLNYLGGAGLPAIADAGRIVMEYDLDTVFRGMSGVLDKETLRKSKIETRKAAEAVDALKGSARLRLVEGMTNQLDSNKIFNTARDSFYMLNLLTPVTTVLKTFAGLVDGDTIISRSIKWAQGKIDPQEMEWLARHGLSIEDARKIAKQPFEETGSGLKLPNTDAWTSPEHIEKMVTERFKYREQTKPYNQMTDAELTAHFAQEFGDVQVYTDPAIVKAYFDKLEGNGPKARYLGYMTDFRDLPDGGFSVHIDKVRVKEVFDRIKADNRTGQQIIDDAKQAFEDGTISEARMAHEINEVEAADLFTTADDFLEYITLHELHHSKISRQPNQTVGQWEDAIDKAAISYMRNQRETGRNNARQKLTEEVAAEQQAITDKFRLALKSGILNVVMEGTPMDKPIITDGVAYIPMRIASQFGMKEHPKFRGYAKVENGFMGLPFQFYSFILANVNKTIGQMGQGQVKNRAIGMATMMGLAYMVLQFKTPENVWKNMSPQDKFARVFDQSGVMAIYSDIFYTSMHTSLALGGPNITGGFIGPKFREEGSLVGAASGLAGAGPSWAVDMAASMYDFGSGNYGAGAKTFIRNLPFARMWFWKSEVNQLTNAIAN